jgi:hypothetical protein
VNRVFRFNDVNFFQYLYAKQLEIVHIAGLVTRRQGSRNFRPSVQ